MISPCTSASSDLAISCTTSVLPRRERATEARASRKSPDMTAARVLYSLCTADPPRRVSAASSTSSCTSDAVWIISVMAASPRYCSLACCCCCVSMSASRAVAWPMRQTRTGRTRFPSRVFPAPKKCCDDAVSTSSLPVTSSHTSEFSREMSSATRPNGSTSGAGSTVMSWQRKWLKLIWFSALTVEKVWLSSTTRSSDPSTSVATRPPPERRAVLATRPLTLSMPRAMRATPQRLATAEVTHDSSSKGINIAVLRAEGLFIAACVRPEVAVDT